MDEREGQGMSVYTHPLFFTFTFLHCSYRRADSSHNISLANSGDDIPSHIKNLSVYDNKVRPVKEG